MGQLRDYRGGTGSNGGALDQTRVTLTGKGKTVQLTAIVSPENAGNKEVEWDSSDTSVAIVSDSGLVSAVADGTCRVTVTTGDGKKTASCAVTVKINGRPGPEDPTPDPENPTPDPEDPNPEKPFPSPGRVAGRTRYETALECAELLRQEGTFSAVVIASADNFPDALAGSTLVASIGAPILLAGKSSGDTNGMLAYVEAHVEKAGQVYILGGSAAVPERVEEALSGYGFTNIKRLSGASRYDTNLRIAEELTVEKGADIVIASGTNYADSLSISGIAGTENMPIFLVGNKLTEEAEEKIREIEPSHIYIIGGTGAVNDEAYKQAETLCTPGNVIRIAGESRYATSLAVARYFGMDQEEFLKSSNIVNTYVMGGSGVISDDTLKHLMK